MENPATLLELCDRFADEETCWRYLKQVRWPKGFACRRCKAPGASFVATRRLWQCRRCRHQVSVTAGTIFHGTRVPLRKWFLALFFLARHKQVISALQLQRDLGLGSYQTAWTMLHKLRSALVFVSGSRPILGRKLQYFRDPKFAERARIPAPASSDRLPHRGCSWATAGELAPPESPPTETPREATEAPLDNTPADAPPPDTKALLAENIRADER